MKAYVKCAFVYGSHILVEDHVPINVVIPWKGLWVCGSGISPKLKITIDYQLIDLVIFATMLTSRQTREKLQCLYENLMSNNFRKTAVLKNI